MVITRCKLTETNQIPGDWEFRSLNNICESIIDGTHYTPKYVKEGVPFYSVENVSMDDFKNTKFITKEEHEKLIQRCNPEKGDILLTRIGTLGATKLIDWEVDASIYVSLALLKIRKSINANYIYSYTKSRSFVKSVIKNSLVNAVPQKINMNAIGNIQIPMPKSDEEQQRIATALSDMDDLIRTIEKIIEKKKKIKQGTMQQLLTGEKRLSGFSEKWRSFTLGQICNYQNGRSLEKYFRPEGGYKVISIGNYSTDGKYVPTNNYISNSFFYDIKPYILNKNDLTMILNDKTPTGEILGRVLLIDKDNSYVFNQRTMRLTIKKDNINSLYLYYKINSDYVHNRIVQMAKPGTQIYINTDDVIEFEIRIPSDKQEQKAIAKILSDMDAEIEVLESKLEKYEKLKEGMMQELLTGRIRLV